jgi:hypothetical protein
MVHFLTRENTTQPCLRLIFLETPRNKFILNALQVFQI